MPGIDETLMRSARDENGRLDPKRLGDPLATKIWWTPMVYGSTRLYPVHVSVILPERLELATTMLAPVFCCAMMVCGLVLAVWAYNTPGQTPDDFSMVFEVAAGCVLFFLGLACLRYVMQPLVFDKTCGRFGQGIVSAGRLGPRKGGAKGKRLESIRAIQLLYDGISSGSPTIAVSSDPTYHLNLVLDDATRFSITRSRSEEDVLRIAMALADFLEKPIWDAR
jgi:hypothetical protein